MTGRADRINHAWGNGVSRAYPDATVVRAALRFTVNNNIIIINTRYKTYTGTLLTTFNWTARRLMEREHGFGVPNVCEEKKILKKIIHLNLRALTRIRFIYYVYTRCGQYRYKIRKYIYIYTLLRIYVYVLNASHLLRFPNNII